MTKILNIFKEKYYTLNFDFRFFFFFIGLEFSYDAETHQGKALQTHQNHVLGIQDNSKSPGEEPNLGCLKFTTHPKPTI